jgi:hypothetical protein
MIPDSARQGSHASIAPIGFTLTAKETDGTLSDTDDLNPEGKEHQATSSLQGIVDQNRWHHDHLSMP